MFDLMLAPIPDGWVLGVCERHGNPDVVHAGTHTIKLPVNSALRIPREDLTDDLIRLVGRAWDSLHWARKDLLPLLSPRLRFSIEKRLASGLPHVKPRYRARG